MAWFVAVEERATGRLGPLSVLGSEGAARALAAELPRSYPDAVYDVVVWEEAPSGLGLPPGGGDRAAYLALVLRGDEVLEGYTVEAATEAEAAREALWRYRTEYGGTPALRAEAYPWEE
jgi:hypothetical protein